MKPKISALLDAHMRALNLQHVRMTREIGEAAKSASLEDYAELIGRRLQFQMDESNSCSAKASANLADWVSRRTAEISGFAPDGIWLPLSIGSRGLSAGTASAGGVLVGTPTDGALIEVLRPFSGIIRAGATVISGLRQGRLTLPRFSTGAGVAWLGENGAVSTADPGFDTVTIVPTRVAAAITFSRELALMSSLRGGIQGVVISELMAAIWAEIDRVALYGSGIGDEPRGLLNDAAVPTVAIGTNGGAPTTALLAEMERTIGAANASPSAWFTTAAARSKLRQTPRNAGASDGLWTDANAVLGYPAIATEHLPSNLAKGTGTDLSALLLGDFSQIVIGIWGPAAIDVIVNPYTYGDSGHVRILAQMEVGIGWRHATAFAKCVDLATA